MAEETDSRPHAPVHQLHQHSSLVRRARLIRRSTTNHYCELLRRLQRDDDSLINQLLIICRRPAAEASEMEQVSVSGVAAKVVPSVEFAYPPIGKNSQALHPAMFYPDFMRQVQEKEAYPVILTNEKGTRNSWVQEQLSADYSVLVLISQFPNEVLFHQLAVDFVNNYLKDSSKLFSMSRDLLQLRVNDSNNAFKRFKYVVRSEPRWSRHLCTLVDKLGVENTVLGFLCLLAEKRVLVCGSNVSDVSRAVQCFVRLLSPLEWPYTLVPLVPDNQTELCHNPTPYICGILRYNLNQLRDLIVPLPCDADDDIVIMDLERGIVVPCLPLHSIQDTAMRTKALLHFAHHLGFPRSLVTDLLTSFKSVFKKPYKGDEKLEKVVMIWYARVFGHYFSFGDALLSARTRKKLALAHPKSETREMLRWFCETGILQSFFFSQANGPAFASQSRVTERFRKIIKQYSPPVSKKGKRRKARSLIWRILNH